MHIIRRLSLQAREIPGMQRPLEALESQIRGLRRGLGMTSSPRPHGFELIREGTVTIDAPDYEGTFTLSAKSHLFRRLAQDGFFEPECAAAVKRVLSPKRDAIDVGANIGFFSVLLGKRVDSNRKVLAVEPVPSALRFLRTNLKENGVADRVVVFEGAAGVSTSTQSIELVSGREEYSALNLVHPSAAGYEKETVQVRVESLDSLVEEHGLEPGLIKVDVEGSELLVLRGAEATLRNFRPNLFLEYEPKLLRATGFDPSDLLAFLEAHSYGIEWLTETEILAKPR